MVRDKPDPHLDVVARAFKWSRDEDEERARERAPVEPAGEPRVLLRRDRRGRQLRRHLPVRGARLRQRRHQGSAGPEPLRGPRRRCRRSKRRAVQGPDGRDRTDPHRRRAPRSKRIRCSARTSGSFSSRTPPRSIRRTRRTSGTSRRSSGCCRSARGPRCCCAATSTTRASQSSARWAARPTSGPRR